MKYKEAIEELEQILAEINGAEADIDLLAEKLKRATELIKFCKTRLRSTESEIKEILGQED